MRPLILFLLLPCFCIAGDAPFRFDQVNAHFSATFNGQPEAMNANVAKAFTGAAGFGISRMPAFAAPTETFEIAGQTYRFVHLQLLGIVDRDAPQLYPPLGTPTKERIKQVKGKPLADFEVAAVAALAAGKNLHVAEPKHHAVFGALRADQSCLRCHEGKPGDLFGAFKYTVVKIQTLKPLMKPKPKPAQKKRQDLLSKAD
jgi:hypothetical protein